MSARDPEAPPWYWRTAYRCLYRRLPARYGTWVVRDVTAPGWAWRLAVTKYLNWLLLVAAAALVWRAASGTWSQLLLYLDALLAGYLPFEVVRGIRRPATTRGELLDHQELAADGTPSPEPPGTLARLRARLLPARDTEAVAYLAAVVLALGVTAVAGLERRPQPPPAGSDLACAAVPSGIRSAIEATLPEGMRLRRTAGHAYAGGLAVAALGAAPGGRTGFAVWLVTMRDRRPVVRVASTPAPQVSTSAPVVDVAAGPLYLAVYGAYACYAQASD